MCSLNLVEFYTYVACEQQTHFWSSLLSLRKIPEGEKRWPEMRLLFTGSYEENLLFYSAHFHWDCQVKFDFWTWPKSTCRQTCQNVPGNSVAKWTLCLFYWANFFTLHSCTSYMQLHNYIWSPWLNCTWAFSTLNKSLFLRCW